MTYYNGADGATLRAANTGGLYRQQAPQAVVEPYTVFVIASSSIQDSMGGQTDRIETVDVNFNIVTRDDGGGVIGDDIADKLILWLDDKRFSISGSFSNIRTERIGITSISVTDEIWQTSLFYTIWVDW